MCNFPHFKGGGVSAISKMSDVFGTPDKIVIVGDVLESIYSLQEFETIEKVSIKTSMISQEQIREKLFLRKMYKCVGKMFGCCSHGQVIYVSAIPHFSNYNHGNKIFQVERVY